MANRFEGASGPGEAKPRLSRRDDVAFVVFLLGGGGNLKVTKKNVGMIQNDLNMTCMIIRKNIHI